MKCLIRFLAIAVALIFLLAPAQLERRMNILVFPFRNTGSLQHSWISSGLTDTVIADLQRLKSVNVFSDEERKKACNEIALGMTGIIDDRDVAKAGYIMGANLIFTGSYTVIGKSIRVVAKLVDVETTRLSKSRKLDGTLDGIFNLQDRIVAALMEETEAVEFKGIETPKFTEQEKKEVKKKHTPPRAAFEYYSRALEKYESSPREALSLAMKAVQADPKYHNALTYVGGLYTNTGESVKANQYYSLAKKALVDSGMKDSADYAHLLQNMARASWNRGDNTSSIQYNMEAMKILELLEKKESSNYADMLMLLGSAYRNLGDLQKGLLYTRSAKETLERLGLRKTSLYSWNLSNLGVIHQLLKNYSTTLELYGEANRIWESLGMKRSSGYAYTYSQIGNVYYSKGEYQKALEFLKEGMALCEELGFQNSIQYGNYSWTAANALWMMGRYCDGVPYMKKAVDVYTSVGHAETSTAQNALRDFKNSCDKK